MSHWDGQEKKPIEIVNEIKSAYDMALFEIGQKEIIRDALLEKLVRQIKMNQSRYDIAGIEDAIAQKENKKKSERQLWIWLLHSIKTDFFPEYECEFVENTYFGYERYCVRFTFKYKEKMFDILIPIMKNINTSNIEMAAWGKYKMYSRYGTHSNNESVCHYTLCTSYEIVDIRNTIKD